MSRTMAIDWGEKRLGIAVTDPMNVTAQPLAVIPNLGGAKTWEALRKLIDDYQIGRIVVGIPFRTDGRESEKAARVREWIAEAKTNLACADFAEVDERLTTAHAQRLLHEGGMKMKKQKDVVDKIAAALILEQYLAQNAKS